MSAGQRRAEAVFSGIIQTTGEILARDAARGDSGDLSLVIRIGEGFDRPLETGASISVNGVCLTVVEHDGDSFRADVSRETLACSALRNYAAGTRVNLESAVTPETALGGHLVSGHVDGVGAVLKREEDDRSVRFRIRAPEALARYLAPKGSICVDGVSLTLNRVENSEFEVNIVPHTLTATIISDYRLGHEVNLEVDVVARYLERLLQYRPDPC
jgi:riboflavin synthase